MEFIIGGLVLLGILSIIVAAFKKYYKQILSAIFFLIPMALFLPSLLEGAFRADVALGYGLVLAGIVGWTMYAIAKKDYPTLKSEIRKTRNVVGGVIALAAAISGIIWGASEIFESGMTVGGDNVGMFLILLIAMIYGGLGLAVLIAPLFVIPWRYRLSINRAALAKRIKSAPLNEALSLVELRSKLRIKNVKWVIADFIIFARKGTAISNLDERRRYIQTSVGGENFILYGEDEIISLGKIIDREKMTRKPPKTVLVPGSIISLRGHNALKERTENYLYQYGNRTLSELKVEMMLNINTNIFMFSALNESVKNGVINVTSKGFDSSANEKAIDKDDIYAHKQKPIKNNPPDPIEFD